MESGLYSRAYLQNQMPSALGGRVAEEIVYGGGPKSTTGPPRPSTGGPRARSMGDTASA